MSTSRQFTIKKHFPTKFRVSAYGYYNNIVQFTVSNSETKNVNLSQWTLPELTYTASNQCPGTVSLNAGDFPDYTYRNSDLKVLMPYNNGQVYMTPATVHNPYLENHSCTITNGVISNFSDNNYVSIRRNFSPSSSDVWVQQWKFTTASSLSSDYQSITGALTDIKSSPHIATKGEQIQVWMSSDSYNWDISNGEQHNTGDILQTNTTYWVRVEFTGSSYILSYSTDGTNFTVFDTIQSSTPVKSSEDIVIGVEQYNSPFQGTVDLNESWIEVNNEIFWEYPQAVIQTMNLYGCLDSADTSSAHTYTGYSLKNANNQRMVLSNSAPSVSGFTTYKLRDITIPAHDTYTYSETSQEQPYTLFNIVGNLSFSNGIASDFGESDYMTCTGFSSITSGTFLFRVYFTSTGTNTILKDLSTDYEKYFACEDYYGIYDNGWTKSNNSQITDQWHFIRLEIKDGVSSLYTLVDNGYTIETLPPLENWRFECSINNNLFNNASSFQIGGNLNWVSGYLRGQLDLSKSQIIINDQVYWQRTIVVPVWTSVES